MKYITIKSCWNFNLKSKIIKKLKLILNNGTYKPKRLTNLTELNRTELNASTPRRTALEVI